MFKMMLDLLTKTVVSDFFFTVKDSYNECPYLLSVLYNFQDQANETNFALSMNLSET